MKSFRMLFAFAAVLVFVFFLFREYGRGDDLIQEATHRIVFQTSRDGNGEIYVMEPDGTNLTNLTRHDSLDYHPTGSPDGSLIAFVSGRGTSREVEVMDSDCSNQRLVTDSPDANIVSSFSPYRRLILFVGAGDERNTEMCVSSISCA